jgi:hypothetical protein
MSCINSASSGAWAEYASPCTNSHSKDKAIKRAIKRYGQVPPTFRWVHHFTGNQLLEGFVAFDVQGQGLHKTLLRLVALAKLQHENAS